MYDKPKIVVVTCASENASTHMVTYRRVYNGDRTNYRLRGLHQATTN